MLVTVCFQFQALTLATGKVFSFNIRGVMERGLSCLCISHTFVPACKSLHSVLISCNRCKRVSFKCLYLGFFGGKGGVYLCGWFGVCVFSLILGFFILLK